MFTFLALRNFRAFDNVELELRPLTILVGPNNAGKSSLLSGLRILSQTVLSEDFRVPLLLKGPLGDFGTYRDLVYENVKSRNVGISLGIALPRRAPAKEARLDLTFSYRPQRREVVLRESVLSDETRRKILAIRASSDPERHRVEFFGVKGEVISDRVTEKRIRMIHFLAPIWALLERNHKVGNQGWFSENRRGLTVADDSFDAFLSGLRSVEYIGPFRAEPQRTNLFSGERPTTVGVDGAKAIDLLAADYLRRGRRKRELLNRAVQWFRKAEIAKDFRVRVLGDRHYETLIQHPTTNEFENLADVGYGSSQVLPVIAGGYNLSSGSTFIVEEPEIHLHPKAQAELGDFFFDLYKGGIQGVVETHSEHLILRLQRHVAAGRIRPQDICVYFVYAISGQKVAAKLTLDDNGIFEQTWPRGFFEERLKEVTELARAPLAG